MRNKKGAGVNQLTYVIDGQDVTVSVAGSPGFQPGPAQILSGPGRDATFGQGWYDQGYASFAFADAPEFAQIRQGISAAIGRIVAQELGPELSPDLSPETDQDAAEGAGYADQPPPPGFDLESYHHHVRRDADHARVVARTRDLFPADFGFPIQAIIPKLERFLGFGLSDIDPDSGERVHIIIRINRPGSQDYNPPHKDIYEGVDGPGYIPQFINFWIPICGLTPKTMLPLAPGSHLLPEDQIIRTVTGGVVAGKTYRVRMVQSWGGQTQMIRPAIGYGDALVFSSHLVHGLALNSETDLTRAALEFRLFRRDPEQGTRQDTGQDSRQDTRRA